MGVTEAGTSEERSLSAVVPIRVAQPKEKAAIEMQFGDLRSNLTKVPTQSN